MSGLTVGPRQFTMQKDLIAIKMADSQEPVGNSITYGGSGWQMSEVHIGQGTYAYNQTKLDLRPFYQAQDTKALDLLNITLQESGPFSNDSADLGIFIQDVFTSVKLNRQTIHDLIGQTPGFMMSLPPGMDFTDPIITAQRLSPSSVVWGLWRWFDHDATIGSRLLVLRASSFYGEGEIVVSPSLYWTRVVTMYSRTEGDTMLVPAANLVCHAAAVNISDGQEMAQMSRMAGR